MTTTVTIAVNEFTASGPVALLGHSITFKPVPIHIDSTTDTVLSEDIWEVAIVDGVSTTLIPDSVSGYGVRIGANIQGWKFVTVANYPVGTISLADLVNNYAVNPITLEPTPAPDSWWTALANLVDNSVAQANQYTDEQIADVTSGIDSDIAASLASANGYTDTETAAALTSANGYTDMVVADLVARQSVNVKKYGAKGDGVTDDRGSIQAALDAIGVGGTLYFPPGTYLLTTMSIVGDRILRTYKDQTLYGAGKFSSVLKVGPSFGGYKAVIGAATDSTYVGHWSARDLGIDQDSANNALVIATMATLPRMAIRLGSFTPGSSVSVSDCAFMNGDSVNCVYTFADTIEIRGNQFLDQGGPVGTGSHDHSTIYLSTPLGMGTELITGNTFRGVLGSGGARTAVETHGGAQTVVGNVISSYATGMNLTGVNSYFATDSIVCTGNVVSRVCIGLHVWSQYAGAVTTGAPARNVILADNSITVDRDSWGSISGFLAYGYGILIDPGNNAPIDGLSIENNSILYLPSVVTPPVTDRHSTGINVEITNAAAEVRNMRIVGNTITNPLSAGMLLIAPFKRASVRDNIVIDPAQSTEASIVTTYRAAIVLGGSWEDAKFENNLLVDTRATHYSEYNIIVLSTLTVATNCVARNNVTRYADGAGPRSTFTPSSTNVSGTEFFVEETNALGATPSFNTKIGSTVTVSGNGRKLVQITSPVGNTWKQALALGATVATAAPAAGAGSALPATPAGYITLNVNGTDRQVAYY